MAGEFKGQKRENPGEPGCEGIDPFGAVAEVIAQASMEADEDRGAEEGEVALHPAAVEIEAALKSGPPTEEDGESGQDREDREGRGGDGAGEGAGGHAEATGSNEEQDVQDLDAPQNSMPFRKAAAEGIAEKEQPEDQGEGAGEDVDIEGNVIAVPEVRIAAAEKVVIEVGGKVVGIEEEGGEDDLENEQHSEQGEDFLQEGCQPEVHEGCDAMGEW